MSTKISLTETFELLEKNKISLADYKVLENQKDLKKLKYPIYIKIDSQKHKLKIGAVKKCNNLKEAVETTNHFLKKFPHNLLILQEEVVGREIFVGIN